MSEKHPYIQAPGNLAQVLRHLRNSFPTQLTADTLRKLGFAPKNESYVLNVLRHLKLIDEAGNRSDAAAATFTQHDDDKFASEFSRLVESAYSELFDLYQDNAWDKDLETLVTFFRNSDQTTALVGKHQARTFQVLAAFSGHGEIPDSRATQSKSAEHKTKPTKVRKGPAPKPDPKFKPGHGVYEGNREVGLTVRIEINLPASGDQGTYDRIFKSIRENLLNDTKSQSI